MSMEDALMLPVVMIFYAALDYAVWPLMEMLGGGWAFAPMLLTILVEAAGLLAMVSRIGDGR